MTHACMPSADSVVKFIIRILLPSYINQSNKNLLQAVTSG